MDIRRANQNVTDSRQTISNRMQAAVLIISPSPMLASGNKAPILLMHDLPALRVYQGDIEYKYISPCTCTCDARMLRTRDDMFVTQSAGRAAAHLWRMPGFSRTSINALHWWWPRVKLRRQSIPACWQFELDSLYCAVYCWFISRSARHICVFLSLPIHILKLSEICFDAIYLKLDGSKWTHEYNRKML